MENLVEEFEEEGKGVHHYENMSGKLKKIEMQHDIFHVKKHLR